MAKFLVAGGAGFIGSHIAAALLGAGHFVRVLDNFCAGKEENLSFTQGLGETKFELARGDIRDRSVCEAVCEGMDYVLMQAALKSVPKSLLDPESFNDVNINGVLAMLQAASRKKIRRFVFASSSSVYGTTDQFPQKETHLPRPISPYALTKLAGEHYCRIFTEAFGLETVCLRYFNIFGPRQAADDEYAAVIPKFIQCLMRGEPPPIFGTGQQSRDFTFVENVVSANILAALTPGLTHEIFNVATGHDHTVLELVEVLNKILRKNIPPQHLPVRQGDLFKSYADISAAKEKLKYAPLVTFEEGLQRTAGCLKAQS